MIRQRLDLALLVLRIAIAGLAGLTAYVHWMLGSPLFVLNAIGYIILGMTAISLPHGGIAARIGLLGYTLLTIALWVLIGPRFGLAYVTKVIELTLVFLLIIDLRHYGFRTPWRDAQSPRDIGQPEGSARESR